MAPRRNAAIPLHSWPLLRAQKATIKRLQLLPFYENHEQIQVICSSVRLEDTPTDLTNKMTDSTRLKAQHVYVSFVGTWNGGEMNSVSMPDSPSSRITISSGNNND